MDDGAAGGCGCLVTLVIVTLGWFIYGGIKGAIGIFALMFILNIVALAGMIPLLGQIIYWFVAKQWIIPFVLNIFGFENTWLVTVVFWIGMIVSIFAFFRVVGGIRKA